MYIYCVCYALSILFLQVIYTPREKKGHVMTFHLMCNFWEEVDEHLWDMDKGHSEVLKTDEAEENRAF